MENQSKKQLYSDNEYQFLDLGSRKIILSILDDLGIGKSTDLGDDFSETELCIFAESVTVSRDLKTRSFEVFAHDITAVTSQTDKPEQQDGNNQHNMFFATKKPAFLDGKKILQWFDWNNEKYISITASTIPDTDLLCLEETVQTGMKNINLSKTMFAHPTQCSMLLEKAQLLYREGDPNDNSEALQNANILLQRLKDRTEIFGDLADDSPLVKLYQANEGMIGAVDSIDTFRSINKRASSLLAQIKSGYDYYGNSYKYVPLASFSFYQKILNDQIEDYKNVEATFMDFFNAERSEEERLSDLRKSRSSLEQIIRNSDTQIELLKGRIEDTVKEIDQLQIQAKEKEEILEQKMKAFEHAIEEGFYLDIKSIFSSLTTLAFLSDNPFGWILAGGEISYNLYEGSQSVEDDTGMPVKKEYILQQLKCIDEDLDTDPAEFPKQLDKQFDDDKLQDSNKMLIAKEDQLNACLKKFYGKFPKETKELEAAFEDYANIVLARNNKIVTYNAMISLILKNRALIQDSEQKLELLNEDNLKSYQPNLPAFKNLMSSLYNIVQTQVMETLYLTERAFLFWGLSDSKPVTEILRVNKTADINAALLETAQSSILSAYGKTIEKYGMNAQEFPARQYEVGVLWFLNQDQVEGFKGRYDGEYRVMFKISAVEADTDKTENDFAGMADVRLTKVRVWINGAKVDKGKDGRNLLTVTLTHTGDPDTILDQNNNQFPFIHDSKSMLISYDLEVFEKEGMTMNLFEDGDIGQKDNGSTYALVGPFTWWQVSVHEKLNPGLDISDVDSVCLEFHGTNYTFLT